MKYGSEPKTHPDPGPGTKHYENQGSFVTPTGQIDTQKLTNLFRPSTFKKGQALFRQDSYPYGVFYIQEGRVKIFRITGDAKEKIIRIAENGEFIGYADLLAGNAYSTSAEPLEETQVYFIPQDDFLEILRNDNRASFKFMNLLCQELGEIEDRLTEMAFIPVRGRLAENILRLDQMYAHGEQADEEGFTLSRADLANLVGTAKETVARFLSEFKSAGLIRTEGRRIVVTDRPGLTRVAREYN